ncbi:MAG: hypothetical protein WC876_04505 [Candidatus Thermoplasmatota archaeon]
MSDNTPSNIVEGRFIKHLEDLHKRTANDDDVVIVITGGERKGKSGLAYVAASFLDPELSPEAQFHWSVQSYMASATSLRKRKPIVHDELVRGGSSYKFMTPENMAFADFLTVCGYRNLFHILIMPSKRWISPIIKEHRAWYNWHVVRRFRDHAVAKCYQLRDDDVVFDKPRLLFTFTYPRPEGPKWKRILELKDEFAQNIGRGTADVAELFKAERARMARQLRVLFGRSRAT